MRRAIPTAFLMASVFPSAWSQSLSSPSSLSSQPNERIKVSILDPPLQQSQQVPSVPSPSPNEQAVPALPPYLPQTIPLASSPSATALRPERIASRDAYDPGAVVEPADQNGSVFIPVDNWIYTEMVRLYELGYADSIFLGLRPWTRRSVLHALHKSQTAIMQGRNEEAKAILATLLEELRNEDTPSLHPRTLLYGTQSAYTRLMAISGTPLRDSFHLGETISNDYGRPYEHGFNMIAGLSTIAEAGRFSLDIRAEYQHAPAALGYSTGLATQLSANDQIVFAPPNDPQATIPSGSIAAQNRLRIIEANLSYHVLSHEVSFGKSDAWLGPAAGASMAWSNNAEDIYCLRVNRVEPLHVPLLSRLIGPVRYDFFYGSLKGHTYPNSPYVHSEAFSFQPTSNLEIGFQRTIIFGGQDHAPVTLHLFLKGFFSPAGTNAEEKLSRNDPGARFSSFQASYRLPLMRHYATFYVDSNVHDDVSPIDAPRRAAYRTGIDVSQFPGFRKLEFRVEAASTDPGIRNSNGGSFFYVETIQKQGYTNNGVMMSDWIGREAKGGQAWLTYHLAPKEWVQLEYLNKKTAKDFSGGTTQNQLKIDLVKRFARDYEVNAWYQREAWKAPIYLNGQQKDSIFAAQITWFPKLRSTQIGK